MTLEDVVKLLAFIEEASPAQRVNEYTPEVWHEIIPVGFTLGECREAVVALKQRQTWIDVSDIVMQVRRARRPAEEAAHLAAVTYRDPNAARAKLAADNATTAAALARIRARAGLPLDAQIKAVPPPGDEDGETG